MSDDLRDAFISYGRVDAEWVRILAENLRQAGIKLSFDEWEIGPGDNLVHKLDQAILTSRNGILVVSPDSLSRPWVQQEYAAMMNRVVAGQQNLIPVLYRDAEMPPLMAARVWVDFRNVDGPDYNIRLAELVRALRGRPEPPRHNSGLQPPASSAFKVARTRSLLLSIGMKQVTLSGDDADAAGPLPQPRFDGGNLQWTLERARTHASLESDGGGRICSHAELECATQRAGRQLVEACLPREVSDAMAAAVSEAERLNGTVQLALSVAEPFAGLPWEAICLPQIGELALHPRVALFRRVETDGAAPAIAIPGPLRILVAIGSPETRSQRGELLDMEAELRRILDATEAAQRAGKAFIRILEQGSVAAIHAALAARRFHILHISCQAAPGQLVLEDAHGREDRVTAKRLWEEAIPAQRAPPLVVLAGCSTGQGAHTADGGAEGKLPGLARTLVQHGVPAVIAMQASVSDRYATELMGEVYNALSSWEQPLALAALNHARRTLENRRRADASPLRPPPEWTTPALFCAGIPLSLYDPKSLFEAMQQAPESVFDQGVVVRRIGDMVGRRSEQRLMLQSLRHSAGSGVLIQGIGGVGKSTLAAQILHRIAEDDGFLLVSLEGETNPDRVLGAIATRLLTACLAWGHEERHPWRQLASFLRELRVPWRERFEVLAQNLLSATPLAFLFDNFEDNLHDGAPPEQLAELLSLWLQRPAKSRLLFTSRHPFALPKDAHDRLAAFPLGPLSWPETRKLFRRLEGFQRLDFAEQRRAYEVVGGHPRALEYLDAILRGGKARFTDIQVRMRRQLADKGIADPSRWCADTAGGLDAALATTVTLAADDVLLDQLLAELEGQPLAQRLLFAAAVYQTPVDERGLIWLVAERTEPDAARQFRLQKAAKRLEQARQANPSATLADIASSQDELSQWVRDTEEERRAPVRSPRGFSIAKQVLTNLSLLATVRVAEEEDETFVVHRWTASALGQRTSEEQKKAAHGAAAAYWLWRVENLPQQSDTRIADLLEARHHLLAVGDLIKFCEVSLLIIMQLDTAGAREWEEQLTHHTLARMPEQSRGAAGLLWRLGVIAQRRGDYHSGLEWYGKALETFKQLGDRHGVASCYGQFGNIAQEQGNYEAALAWYGKALSIFKQLGDYAGLATYYYQRGAIAQYRGKAQAALEWYRKSLTIRKQNNDHQGMASSYLALGRLDEGRGAYDAALRRYHKALTIFKQLGDRQGTATSYSQLGKIVQRRGDINAALDWYRKSLELLEQLGDRAGIATSYHNLGTVAQQRHDHDGALDWYRKSLELFKQLGNRAGLAKTYYQMGMVAKDQGDTVAALDWTPKSLAIFEQLGDRDGMAKSYHQLGMIAHRRGETKNALDWYSKAITMFEQIGDRADMANSLSQVGVLLMESGKVVEAIPSTLQSLTLRRELKLPQSRFELGLLSRQRQMLGATAFSTIVTQRLGPKHTEAFLTMLDSFERESQHGQSGSWS
jgi:tetratricopeptide (TPR) repeat protein